MRWEPEQQQNELSTEGTVISVQGERSQAAARDINNVSCQTGQAAGRDINTTNTTNTQVTVINIPERRSEARLQADFAASTGIWCPKEARLWLEDLIEHHGFTGKELRRAWQVGSIGWSTKRGERYISAPLAEAVVGYIYYGGLSVVFFVPWLAWLLSERPQLNGNQMLALAGCGAIYLGLVWLLANFTFLPRRVALRIQRITAPTPRKASGA